LANQLGIKTIDIYLEIKWKNQQILLTD